MSFLTEVTFSSRTRQRIAQRRDTLLGAFSSTLHEAFSGKPHHQRRDILLGPHHQIDIGKAFHGCRVKSYVFPAEIHTLIKHAPSPKIKSGTRALVMISRQSFQLSESKQM